MSASSVVPQRSRVLLTGASSGIGAALAVELARRGHHLWLAARRVDRLADIVATIRTAGGSAVAVGLDVADHRAAAATIAALDDEIGGFDVVVANAGVGGTQSSVWSITIDDAVDVVGTNLLGSLATILPLLPKMKARGRGHVVGVSSMIADIPQAIGPVYGASKSGLSYFLDAVAPELEGAGIAVTIVHPGFVKTPMTDQQPHRMPFMIDDATAARAMADAIEGRRRWLRFPFIQNVIATGGAWLPRSLRHRIVSRSIRR